MERSPKPVAGGEMGKLINPQEVPESSQLSSPSNSMRRGRSSPTVPPATQEPLPLVAPKGADIDPTASRPQVAKHIRLDILGPDQLSLYQFMGYLLHKAGELDKIYEVRCQASKKESQKKLAEYEKKLKEMRESGDFSSKLEMPPDNELPEKVYEEMFEEYLQQHEVGLTDPLPLTLFDRKFIVQYRIYDKISTERIRTLPDGVIFLVDGQEESFKQQFMECVELKQALFMHLFFGTQKVFFLDYFNYRDRLLKLHI